MITQPAIDNAPDDEDNLLPARMLNEFVYCPRLFYLEHVEGLFAHNADTIEGAVLHKRVDGKTEALPAATDIVERESIHARSVSLASDRHGLIAKLDLVESDGLLATPVDYKRGSPKKLDDGTLGAWDPERVQLCVQALVLRENGYTCDEGVLYFWETRQRVRIAFDQELIAMTEQAIADARQTMRTRMMPPPLENSPKCPRCSLVSICLPDETTRCAQEESLEAKTEPQQLLFDIGPRFGAHNRLADYQQVATRQLITPRDDKRPLYLNTQGYSVGISDKVLKVKDKAKTVQEVRLSDINQVNLFGAVQVSTQAVQALLAAEVPLIYFSFGGWFHGMTQPVGLKNIPFMGYYHQLRFGRPSLALDLMEPFRPLVVDSAVLSAINQRMVTVADFISAGDAVALTPSGRKGFFRAYEQRMDQLVTHPLFGYRVSYRRLVEIQTRLLARVLLGELRSYPVFVTR